MYLQTVGVMKASLVLSSPANSTSRVYAKTFSAQKSALCDVTNGVLLQISYKGASKSQFLAKS